MAGAGTAGHVVVGMLVEQCWQPVPGGSATYIVRLIKAIAAESPGLLRGVSAAHRTPAQPSFVPPIPVRQFHLPREILYPSWRMLDWPRIESVYPDITVTHAPTWAIPGTRRPLIVTVHDLAFVRSPELFTAHGVRFFRGGLSRALAKADAVVVPSNVTANDCLAAGFGYERIHVIPHGVDAMPVTAEDIRLFRQRVGVGDRPYVVWVGTREPRKNLQRLIGAYALIASDFPDLDLVLVGPSGWGEREVLPRDVDPARIHLAGFVDDKGVRTAMAGAEVLCFPSTWEGFGLPVLEAMAQGTPVVTSTGTAMAEFADGVGRLVDPFDVVDIAKGIAETLSGDRDEIGGLAKMRAGRYSWTNSARKHLEIYQAYG